MTPVARCVSSAFWRSRSTASAPPATSAGPASRWPNSASRRWARSCSTAPMVGHRPRHPLHLLEIEHREKAARRLLADGEQQDGGLLGTAQRLVAAIGAHPTRSGSLSQPRRMRAASSGRASTRAAAAGRVLVGAMPRVRRSRCHDRRRCLLREGGSLLWCGEHAATCRRHRAPPRARARRGASAKMRRSVGRTPKKSTTRVKTVSTAISPIRR